MAVRQLDMRGLATAVDPLERYQPTGVMCRHTLALYFIAEPKQKPAIG
jgi:hypothetical protein